MHLKLDLYDDFQRVCPQTGELGEPDRKPMGRSAVLSGGRGEFVSFQMVLATPDKPGQAATITPSDLAGPGTISARQYDLFAEWYILTGKPVHRGQTPDPNEHKKYIPDGLLPLDLFGGALPLGIKSNKVPQQRNQAVWVDLFIPKDAKPGRYAGKLTVRSAGGELDVPVELTVLGFACPDKLSLPFMMNNYVDAISTGWKGLREQLDRHKTPRYRRIESSFYQMAHDHRSVFYYLPYTHSGFVYPTFAPPLTGAGAKKKVGSWSEFDRHFGGYFDGSAFAGTRRGPLPLPRFFLPINLDWPANFEKYGRPGYADEFKAVGSQMAAHFKDRGWVKTDFDMFLNHKQRFKLYPWDCEEVRFLEDNDVHRYFRGLWEGTLDHQTTAPVRFNYSNGSTWTIGLDMHSDLAEFTDMWIGGSAAPAWYPQRMAELQQRGVHFCSCTNCGSIYHSMRAVSWVPLECWMGDADSFMLWLSLGWGEQPWVAPANGGAALLMYPGDEFGLDAALPAMRLKAMRNTLQTVERLELAAARVAGGKAGLKQRVNQTLGLKGVSDWFPPKPDYMDRKLPKDWVGADFATEEPPAAGWEKVTATQFKQVAAVAAGLISG